MSEPNYKEIILEGTETSWRRAINVTVNNPYNQAPTLIFEEEDITVLPSGKTIRDRVYNVPMPFQAMSISFDPTNETHVQVYTLLNQLYTEAREARDAEIIAMEEAEVARLAEIESARLEHEAFVAAQEAIRLAAIEAARIAAEGLLNDPPVEPPPPVEP